NEGARRFLRIPPTAVGGSFKSSLQTKGLDAFFESHPRQWVDRSNPAYKRRRLDAFFESHPRQWVDRSSPAYKRRRLDAFFESHPLPWVVFEEAVEPPSFVGWT